MAIVTTIPNANVYPKYKALVKHIDMEINGMNTGVPPSLLTTLADRLHELAENYGELAGILRFTQEEAAAIASELSVVLLRKQVKDHYDRGAGAIFVRVPELQLWVVLNTRGLPVTEYSYPFVPAEWRKQLGTLKLCEGDRVLVKDCGMKFNDDIYYLMEV